MTKAKKGQTLEDLLPPIEAGEQVRIDVASLTASTKKDEVSLHSVSFTCKPGEVTLVLAPVHSGESTLLGLLAGEPEHGVKVTSGTVAFNGHPSLFAHKVASVIKGHDLDPSKLVAETMMEWAERAHGSEGCGDLTDVLLKALGLNDVKYKRVGEAGDNESAVTDNHRKRLRLGMALVTNPPLVVVHEPFAEAEPEEAAHVMTLLRGLANRGHTVVIGTDEGMAQSLYKHVDTVLLLSRGHVCYYGSAAAADAWFKAQGHKRPEGSSVPDFMVDLSDGAIADDPEEGEFKRAESVEVATAYLMEYPDGYKGGAVPPMTDDDEAAEES